MDDYLLGFDYVDLRRFGYIDEDFDGMNPLEIEAQLATEDVL